MFVKLKKSKFFKSLSEHLCSIEIVETKNEIPASDHYPRLSTPSDPQSKLVGKAVHPVL